jgi:cell division protein FtsI (penicillin-binding protein 3)
MVPTPIAPGTRVVSTQTAHTLSDMLEQVTTTNGTAPAAAVPGYRVAGKTGTAYRVDPTCHCYRGYVASFIGFAPANDPKVVIAVVLDNPTKEYFGGLAAAPVFQKVMTFTLATLAVPPTSAPPPSLALMQPGAAATSGGLGQTDQLDQPAAAPTSGAATAGVTASPTARAPSPSARAPASTATP